MPSRYIGRFAPSPTGALHMGSLVAAMGSYLQARSQNGQWLLRIEDIDPPREIPGATDDIVRTLEVLGFEWDQDIIWQHNHLARYQAIVEQLWQDKHLYACDCSRKTISQAQTDNTCIYPGTCRQRALPMADNGLRLHVSGTVSFTDVIQGEIGASLPISCGDFIIKRRDGLFAYQLAVVIDDADEGITEVVRGCDLLDNTARQIFLQRQLGLNTPRYCHLPIVRASDNRKLSKQNGAEAIDLSSPVPSLLDAWNFLGQEKVTNTFGSVAEFWSWAFIHWNKEYIPSS